MEVGPEVSSFGCHTVGIELGLPHAESLRLTLSCMPPDSASDIQHILFNSTLLLVCFVVTSRSKWTSERTSLSGMNYQ
jgi:hypothetical protein